MLQQVFMRVRGLYFEIIGPGHSGLLSTYHRSRTSPNPESPGKSWQDTTPTMIELQLLTRQPQGLDVFYLRFDFSEVQPVSFWLMVES
jgi:hypothetical protein